ncbi:MULTISPECIES: hypothetical protein [Sphingomonas]|uniref:Uncharacterized protein n=1 Tax=Sphingomonas leidyi TaxID=68569 RepID=A0A7X5ZUE7_9SPHN|nr:MULTISPECIES: hypothetical protein [Sphingomonas]NIJ64001.1 hypothetical protein [Sphingomonas leidyi]
MIDPEETQEEPPRAHQPDGTDSSAEWDAQIADESMIPDSDPPG